MVWDYHDYRINSVIVKATNCCNLRCRYCYAQENNTNSIRHIDYTLVEKIIKDYYQYTELCADSSDLYIVWHGGEPLSCGIDFYNQIIKLEEKFRYHNPKKNIVNSVQTNGTLFTSSLAQFFKKQKIGIGISLDGIPEHNDINRVYSNGMGSSPAIHKGIGVLKDFSITFSGICVINKISIGFATEYYKYFKKIGIQEVDFIPSFFQNSPYNLSNTEYYSFLKELFDCYYSDQEKKYSIRVFDDILRSFFYNKGFFAGSVGCEFAGRCGENISISVTGDVYPCDCLTTMKKMCIGNLYDNSLQEIVHGEKFKQFKDMVNIIPDECLTCEAKDICHGGCFNRRVCNLEMTRFQKDVYCEARRNIIQYVKKKCKI